MISGLGLASVDWSKRDGPAGVCRASSTGRNLGPQDSSLKNDVHPATQHAGSAESILISNTGLHVAISTHGFIRLCVVNFVQKVWPVLKEAESQVESILRDKKLPVG